MLKVRKIFRERKKTILLKSMKENKSNLISIISLGNDDPVKKTAELFIMMTKDFDEELLLPIVKSGVEVLQ